MHFIRGHACDGIRVGDVVQHVQVSRSTLERRFAKLLGRSPKAEILRVQLDRVKQLLEMTEYPLAKIAQISGFDYVESMCTCFKRTTGQTPGQYRAEHAHH
jgi:LacI family transcriptional regulator